jgi:hypothetical protein
MPETVVQGAGAAGLVTPIRIDGVFDDPGVIRRLVQRNGPYRTMVSYLPASAVRGGQPAAADGVPAHFRATWAAGGRPLVDGAEVILHNPRMLGAASQLFDTEVIPNTVAVNVTAPMPAGNIHVDVPSFRGADRDRYPMQLLQAMAASGLFEDWRVAEAGAVWWNYQGPGGAYDYWPDGLDGPMRSEHPPFINSALVADNNRMYHRTPPSSSATGTRPPATPSPCCAPRQARSLRPGASGPDRGAVHPRRPVPGSGGPPTTSGSTPPASSSSATRSSGTLISPTSPSPSPPNPARACSPTPPSPVPPRTTP